MLTFVSLGLLATIVAGQETTSANTDPASSTSAPAQNVPPPPPRQAFPFLSPMLDFQPAGSWVTSNLAATTNFTSPQPANVSISAPGSGIKFSARTKTGDLRILINGTDSTQLNGTFGNAATNITNVSAEVTGLDYGWYEFTLASSDGNATFDNAIPNSAGARWGIREANRTDASALGDTVQTSGNWTTDFRLATSTPGSALTITVPGATALLELTVDAPTTPFPAFNVSISPAPPYGPAEEAITPNLYPAPIQAAIAQMNVPLYSVLLDPNVDYTVKVTYAGDGSSWNLGGITFYGNEPALIYNGTEGSQNGTVNGTQTATANGTKPTSHNGTTGPSPTSPIGANGTSTNNNGASSATPTWYLSPALLAVFMLL